MKNKEEELDYITDNNLFINSDDILCLIQCGLTDFYNCLEQNNYIEHYSIDEVNQVSIDEDSIGFEVLCITDKETGKEIEIN